MPTYTDTKYPAALDDNTTLPLYGDPPGVGDVLNANANNSHHAKHNVAMDAVKAIQAKLGISSASPVDVPAGSNTVLLSDASGKSKWGVVPGMALIADTVLVASATNITFASIPATYKHLLLVFSGRGDGAVASDLVRAQFNADTGSNYVGDYNTNSGASAPTSTAVNTTSLVAGEVSGASDTAGAAGLGRLEILDYASTTLWKVCEMAGGVPNQQLARNGMMTWKSTAAITSIKLFPTTSTNFVAGTRATIYGVS